MVAYTQDGKNVYESKRLDHLGLVAGMYEELGLRSVADTALGVNPDYLDFEFCTGKSSF